MVLVHTCGPNEAMVVSGIGYSVPSYVVSGGRVFAIPYLHMVQRISLNTITLEVHSPKVYTKKGVPISVTGIAQIKVESRKQETLSIACRLFLGKNEEQIQQIALETLEGHQRAIMGLMTVEEIYQDRKKFSEKVFEVAKCDLINMGISVVSYTIKDIRDEHGYLRALGMKRTAEVKRDARIGEAIATRDKVKKQMTANEECQTAKLKNAIDVAMAKRDYELKQAEFDCSVNTNKAKADLAYQLQAAKTKQSLMEENMQVQTVEKISAIQVAIEEVKRKENELNATVRQPAAAEKYRVEKLAAAENRRIILEAEAKAEADKLQGEAQAHVILMKGRADADKIAKKAEAYKEFEGAAMAEMLLDMLPKLADKVGNSMYEGVNNIKMISTGGNEVGAAKLSTEMIGIVERIPAVVSNLAGVDLSLAIKKR